MKLLPYLCAVLLCFMQPSALASEPISKQSITTMMASIDKAIQQQDADALISFFAQDAVIILRFVDKSQPGLKLDVEGYHQRLKQAWSMPMKYDYQLKDLAISVADDGLSGQINDVLVETVVFDGEVMMVTETKEQIEVHYRNGVLKISKLEGVLTLK